MQTMQQLDIFADSRDVMLRNDVLEQLLRRDGLSAPTALALLTGEYPDKGALSAMTVLVDELEREPTAPFADHAVLAIARRALEEEVVPAARRVLPTATVNAWLVPCLAIARPAGHDASLSRRRRGQSRSAPVASGRRRNGRA